MGKQAFFFKGDSLILPTDKPDSDIDRGIPLEFSDLFDKPDIFNIPSLDSMAVITGVSISQNETLPQNWKSIPVRQILTMFSAAENSEACSIVRACHIAQWRRDSRFCGTCGSENNNVQSQPQRICPKCGRTEFPRICPAIIVLITNNENKILLAHNKRFRAGVYSHISGFNEAGETLEETVVREIREEVSIEVKNVEYIKSQAWPFPNSLMLGFKALYASGTIQPDGEEIEDAKWFAKDNLPELPGEGSLSRLIINNWLAGTL